MLLLFVQPVDSNDSLYGGDSKFLAENSKLCEAVMAQILEHLKTLAKDEVGTCPHQLPHALGVALWGRNTAGQEHHRAFTQCSIVEGKQIWLNRDSQSWPWLFSACTVLLEHPNFSSRQPLVLTSLLSTCKSPH